MRAAEAVMRAAREQGLEHFFGIPGGGSPLELIEAGRQSGVHFVNMSHESSAAIAAGTYGRLRKSAGLAMSIRGVGAANLAGGVANAYFERLPLVAICEAPPVSAPGSESVQQCDQPRLFEGVSRYQSTLCAEGAHRQIHDAFSSAVDGRPIPSILHLPAGLGEVADGDRSPSSVASLGCSPFDESAARKAKDFLSNKRRVAIVAGADVIRCNAMPQLLELVETIGAAVLVAMDARGVFPETHPRWAGVFLGLFNPNVIESRVLAKADAVLLVGMDAMMTHAPWNVTLPTCELVARATYSTMSSPEVRSSGDLKATLAYLTDDRRPGFSQEEIQALRSGILTYFQRPPDARFAAQDIIEITRALLPPEGLLLSETGAFVCMLEHLWPVKRPETFLGTSGGRTMGLMVPAALGARLANRVQPMVGIGADGSLLMRLGELEAFRRTEIGLPLIIINDGALGTMKARQQSRGFPDYGLDLHPVDFSAVANACGLHGVAVRTPEEFRSELEKALHAKGTTLIDARVDPKPYQNSFSPTIGDLSQFSRT